MSKSQEKTTKHTKKKKNPDECDPYAAAAVAAAAAAAKSLQSCLTLCDPKDGSPPGSPVPRILQARVLEWGAIAFSGDPYTTDQILWSHKKRILPFTIT